MKHATAALLAVLAGCGVDLEEARVPLDERGTSEQALTRGGNEGIIIGNGLRTQHLLVNALTGHPDTLRILKSSSLEGAALQTPIRNAMVDTAASAVFTDLVQCALGPEQSITVGGQRFAGGYGICPEWKSSAPSSACLETVSACLLARNNGLERHVHVSARGETTLPNPGRFSAMSEVPPHPWVYEVPPWVPFSNFPASLLSCPASGGIRNGVKRNCGWRSEAWRSCTPGRSVLVAFGARDPFACSSSTIYGDMQAGADLMLRVCRGDAPCNYVEPTTDPSNYVWAASAGACGTIRPAVRFTCPSEGRFTVMAAPWLANTADGWVKTGTLSALTIREDAVFPVREGAFYGNLFDPEALNIRVVPDPQTQGHTVVTPPVPGPNGEAVVYKNMFSCADDAWRVPDAYRHERVCATEAGQFLCAPVSVGRCSSACASSDGSLVVGDRDFEGCVDSSARPWRNPLTVFLTEPCELLSKKGCLAQLVQ